MLVVNWVTFLIYIRTVSVCLHTDASTRIEALRDTCNALWLHSSMQRWVSRKPLQTLFYIIHASNQILPQRLALKAAASSVPETKNGVIRMMFVAGHCGSLFGEAHGETPGYFSRTLSGKLPGKFAVEDDILHIRGNAAE